MLGLKTLYSLLDSDYKNTSILSFSVNIIRVKPSKFLVVSLNQRLCQAQIDYNMELQDTLLVLNSGHWLVDLL